MSSNFNVAYDGAEEYGLDLLLALYFRRDQLFQPKLSS